jgi:hypothetical protein
MIMDTTMLERIRTYLVQKRASLGEWLNTSSNDKKTVLLGSSSEAAVLAHLGAIDTAIAKTESGELGVCKVCGSFVDDEILEVDYTADVCIDHLSSEEIVRLEDELALALEKITWQRLLSDCTLLRHGKWCGASGRAGSTLSGR